MANILKKLIPDFILRRIEGRDELIKIIKNSCWLLLERVSVLVSGVLVGIWVTRYLGPEKIGILNYSLSFVALFEPLCHLGLLHIVTREIVLTPDKKDEILGTSSFIRFFSSSAITLVTIFTISRLRPDDATTQLYVMILSVSSIFNAFYSIEFWFLSKSKSKYVSISNSIVLSICALTKLYLVMTKSTLVMFVMVYALEKLLTGIGLLIVYHLQREKVSKWSFDFSLAKKLVSQSWPMIPAAFAVLINLKIDQVMLFQMKNSAEVGIYAAAARLSEIWYFVPAIIAASMIPMLVTSREKDREEYDKKLQQGFNVFAMLALVVAAPIALFSTPLIVALYGQTYAAAGPILAIHIWSGVFIFMRDLFSKWLVIENLLIFALVTQASGAVVNIILNIIFIPKYGGVGSAFATLLSYATCSYFALFFSSKTRKIGIMMTRAMFNPFLLLLGYIRKKAE